MFKRTQADIYILLSGERRVSITIFAAMEKLVEASHHSKQSVKGTISGNLLPPKEWDFFKLDLVESVDPSSGSSVPAC